MPPKQELTNGTNGIHVIFVQFGSTYNSGQSAIGLPMPEAKELEVPERRASDGAGPVEMPNPPARSRARWDLNFNAR